MLRNALKTTTDAKEKNAAVSGALVPANRRKAEEVPGNAA